MKALSIKLSIPLTRLTFRAVADVERNYSGIKSIEILCCLRKRETKNERVRIICVTKLRDCLIFLMNVP